jgi:hypothetical protein
VHPQSAFTPNQFKKKAKQRKCNSCLANAADQRAIDEAKQAAAAEKARAKAERAKHGAQVLNRMLQSRSSISMLMLPV